MTTPRNLERVMSLESALLDDDGPSGNSPELQELMNELMGESSSQDNTKVPPNVPKNQFTTVKMTATPSPQPAYIQNVQRVNQFAQPTNPNPNISTSNITTQVRPTVIPPGRATAPIPARAIGQPLTGAVPVKTDIKSIIPIEKQKEVSDAVNQYMGGAIAYDRFCQILLALVGREAAYKIAESIKKDELKTGPPPTGQAPVVARPPGPPSGAPAGATGMNPSMINKKLSTPAVTPAMGVPIKAVAPGVPNVNPAPVNTTPQSMANLGQQGNATAQQMFNKIVATPMPVVGAPVTGANLPAAKKARPAGPAPGIVTIPSTPGGVPAKSSVTAAMLPMGTIAQPGPTPQLQPGATPQKPKKDEGELEKIADPKAALKDGTDVTRMAGLDLKKELRLMTEDDSQDDPMDKDTDSAFINMSLLKKKISEIAQRRSLTVNEEALQFTSLALQEHLRNILEKLVKASQHRVEAQKDTFPVRVLSDPRKQLRILEQKQREEEQRRRQTELEAAKSDEKNSASAAALQAIADKFKPKLPPGATTPMTTTPGAQPSPTPGAPQPMTRTAVLGQPVAPGQPAQPQPTQGTQLGMAALQSGPPNFTHQHLHQLQQLQSLQQQGKQLQPNQQKLLVYLRQQLHRLHEYQKLQGAFKKQDPTPPDPKKNHHQGCHVPRVSDFTQYVPEIRSSSKTKEKVPDNILDQGISVF
mmetsp:Transcript_2516/g.3330  ORF Transcript_2516/g.3330 Transcript_2516/m.3330 type:complete len:699 (+) Transcript_2516:102-2198(+)